MKIISVVFITFLYISGIVYAQSDTIYQKTWTPSGVAGLNISQIALSDWTQGGDDALSFTIFGNFGLIYLDDPWSLKNSLKLAFGRTKLGSDNFRTNDNEFYLESILTRSVGWEVDPYFSNSIRTVLANGFDYGVDPIFQTSSFFDPGYVTQSLGFAYNKLSGFTTRLGIAVQETFANKFKDRYTEGESVKVETGMESITEGEVSLQDNLLYNSKLRLFSRFDSLDVWDVRWDNTITAKISEYINVNLNVLLIHEISQSRRTQIKEALQLGFTYTLF